MRNINRNSEMLALGNLADMSEEEVKNHLVKEYEADKSYVDQFRILIAFEGDFEGYRSESHFLLENNQSGKLFEVHAAHCSCYGYEGQFQPEETTAQYLLSKHAGWFSEDAKASEWITTNIHL